MKLAMVKLKLHCNSCNQIYETLYKGSIVGLDAFFYGDCPKCGCKVDAKSLKGDYIRDNNGVPIRVRVNPTLLAYTYC